MPVEAPELTSWRDLAACRETLDVDFFPSPEDEVAIGRAKAVCAVCPVVAACLEYALQTRQSDGVWGGQTPRERVKLRRQWLEQVRKAS
jgi:WhiB family redox-sensing transcriptional regulator